MALLLEAAATLDAGIETSRNVLIFDTSKHDNTSEVVSYFRAMQLLNVSSTHLHSIISSHSLCNERYYAVYITPTCSSLKVTVRIDDDIKILPSRRRKSRHGEIRKGKAVKAVHYETKETRCFESQSQAGQFLGVKKGTVSACILRHKNNRLNEWFLYRN